MKSHLFPAIALVLSIWDLQDTQATVKNDSIVYESPTIFNPPTYICYRTDSPIAIDGKLDPEEWDAIPWTADFTDIEGDKRPAPFLQTRVKMAHDSAGMYFAALIEEPHVWATITKHDAVIFHDNDFEIFLNPSNDTHNYLEYEVNALGTVWDLFLTKPYRDGAVVLSNWELIGMQSAVYVEGTINDPSDTDRYWSLEVFIPWQSIYQPTRKRGMPKHGDQMRVNFSRVHWNTEIENGQYKKIPFPGEAKIREQNWVWAPTGVVNIHKPEFWGYVQFSSQQAGEPQERFTPHPEEALKGILRNLYYRQAHYRRTFGHYANSLEDLNASEICTKDQLEKLRMVALPTYYEISLPYLNNTWHIRQDGLIWESGITLQKNDR